MTTITREHLELAAKAAGYATSWKEKFSYMAWPNNTCWNPHICPADAWQLAADCEMRIDFKGKYIKHSAGEFHYSDRFGGITAAEAVTLAAAEIGRAMG